MPELVEQMYCSRQIVIPPKFPYILKRYCKAAIKTQPYDLLRWSYEYFRALTEGRPPPVKLRLEYPVYGTDGGLTRGCLKVLANQMCGMTEVPISIVKRAWQGFCLDPHELVRILCYCEVHCREESVPLLHFVAVAGGMLAKCLTHTMILLCDVLTRDPDGGAAAIPVEDFLKMYRFLARMDASKDCKYIQGYREGFLPYPEELEEAEEEEEIGTPEETDSDDFWDDRKNLVNLNLTGDKITMSNRLSIKMNKPIIGEIKRSPSVERDSMIERENYDRERKERPMQCENVDNLLKQMSGVDMGGSGTKIDETEVKPAAATKVQEVQIHVIDPDENEIPWHIYGETHFEMGGEEALVEEAASSKEVATDVSKDVSTVAEEKADEESEFEAEYFGEEEEEEEDLLPYGDENGMSFVDKIKQAKNKKVRDLLETYKDIEEIVDRFHTTNYDLGMIAGRQMSTTSGEFIVHHIEKEILEYIDQQIAVLPDPDLKKKKAKPEEVAMIKSILDHFIDENMDVICPEEEEVEEEEPPIPEIIRVFAIPGIGPPVDEDIIEVFEQFAQEVSRAQADMFMPRNIRHFLCPPLEKHQEELKYGGMRAKIEISEK